MSDIGVTPAILGWSNHNTGPWSTRLYATDEGGSPRWAKPHARIVEQALRLQYGYDGEGDHYLVVRLGDRFLSDDDVAAASEAVLAALRSPLLTQPEEQE